MVRGVTSLRSVLNLIAIVLLLMVPLFLVAGIGISLETITPNDKFFVKNKSGVPDINMSEWTLSIDGLVGRSVQLSYQEILAMPSRNVTAQIKCVEGQAGTAVWGGVQLSRVLELVNVSPNARDVVFYAADDYSSSITLADASGDDVLLAYMMNGMTLPKDQGFPLRLVIPGKAGYKWVQFIVHIKLVGYEYEGYWESRGWDNTGDIRPFSDWSTHAYLQSIAFVLGGLAMVSGYRSASKDGVFRRLPSFVNRRFHRCLSIAFILMLVAVFIYWVVTTYEYRGSVFYTSHGAISALMVAIMVSTGATGVLRFRKGRLGKALHNNLAFLSFILYLGVIMIGLILAGVASL